MKEDYKNAYYFGYMDRIKNIVRMLPIPLQKLFFGQVA